MKSRYLFQILIIFLALSSANCRGPRGRDSSSSTRTRSERAENQRESSRRDIKQNPTDRKRSSKTFSGEEIFKKYNSAVFMVHTSTGRVAYQGSGFFVTATGIGVSNYHNFEGTRYENAQIKLFDGSTYKIRSVIKEDRVQDYIIFQVESNRSNFNYIPIGKRAPKVGEKVFAIGSPRSLENTISEGIVSGLRDQNMLQISVPIDHGSSGGALINEYG